MNTKLKGRDFIDLRDYSRGDMETILQLAFDLKMKLASGQAHPLLPGKILGMLFCSPSTRTRVSFETAITQLGGYAQYYAAEQLQLVGLNETWVDSAQVLSRYVNGLVIRLHDIPGVCDQKLGDAHSILKLVADNATIPVISAIDDMEHPCQAMADIMTIMEKFGPNYRRKKVVAFWGYSSVVAPLWGSVHDLAIAAGSLGMRLSCAYPEGYDLHPDYMNEAVRRAEQSGGSIEIVHDINEAVRDADVIYAKVGWQSIKKTKEEDSRSRESLRNWCIKKEHFDIAAPGAIFMTPMPITRGEQATPEVVDGPMSVMYDEAENRLHTAKSILALTMG